MLHRAAALFRERAEELAPIISADMGKPASEATVEVAKGAAVLDYYAEFRYRKLGTTFSTDFDEDIFTLIEPLGVVALITPWNFPFTIPIRKLSAALAAGNAVVFKPSTNAGITGLMIAITLLDAGLPAGLIQATIGRRVRRCGPRRHHRPHRDIRARAGRHLLHRRGRGRRHGQRHPLRADGQHLEQRREPGAGRGRAIDAGYVWVNDVEARYPGLPFGGWKQSGIGKELRLVDDIMSHTRSKAISIAITPARPS